MLKTCLEYGFVVVVLSYLDLQEKLIIILYLYQALDFTHCSLFSIV